MPTLYFGYGSNLWLHQMRTRCPTSQYLGVARLPSYRWIINDRGYANVVEIPSTSSTSPSSMSKSTNTSTATTTTTTATPSSDQDHANAVYGLVYRLEPSDERRLDLNEGVPRAYTKHQHACAFWPVPDPSHPTRVDTSLPPTSHLPMLIYIDLLRTVPDTPREEYVYRMNRGIEDAVRMGVPEGYVEGVMRGFIPADDGEGEEEEEEERKEGKRERKHGKKEREEGKRERQRVAAMARAQAREFRDESGVCK